MIFGFLDHISGYSITQLCKIAFYKTIYKVVLGCEKIKVRLFCEHWHTIQPKIEPQLNLKPYYDNCCTDTNSIVDTANQIVSGKVVIFHRFIDFDPKRDWLKDPISGKEWSASSFFYEAKVKQEGLGDVKYILEINKFNFLVQVAHAYYLTKDEKYIQYIESSFKGWAAIIKPEQSVVNKIIMDLGFRVVNIVQIIFLCHESNLFTARVLPLLLGILAQHENNIQKFSSPRWLKTGNGGNHNIGEMVGLLCAQWILSSYGCGKYKYSQKKAYRYLSEALDRTIASNGVYMENSTNYARLVGEFLVFFDIIRQVFQTSSKTDEKYARKGYLERLGQYLANVSYYNQLPNIGDNDDAQVLIPFKQTACDLSFITNIYKAFSGDYLNQGQWLYRSIDDNDVYLFTRIGPFSSFREGANVHVHNDVLSVVLGVKGHWVFIDRGCLFYNSGEELLHEYKSITSHNTVIVDGIDQTDLHGWKMSNYPSSKCIENEKHDNGCLMSGEVKYKSVCHRRKIVYNENIIVIEDELSNNNPCNGFIQFFLAPEIRYLSADENNLSLLINDHQIATISIYGVDKLVVENTTYSPSYADEQPTKVIRGYFNDSIDKSFKTIIKL